MGEEAREKEKEGSIWRIHSYLSNQYVTNFGLGILCNVI